MKNSNKLTKLIFYIVFFVWFITFILQHYLAYPFHYYDYNQITILSKNSTKFTDFYCDESFIMGTKSGCFATNILVTYNYKDIEHLLPHSENIAPTSERLPSRSGSIAPTSDHECILDKTETYNTNKISNAEIAYIFQNKFEYCYNSPPSVFTLVIIDILWLLFLPFIWSVVCLIYVNYIRVEIKDNTDILHKQEFVLIV